MPHLTTVILLALLRCGLAADARKPHMNDGVNTPFATAKPNAKLSGAELATLGEGKVVTRQVVSEGGKGGRAMAVQDVAATVETVWDHILAFGDYPKMVAGVQECENYEVTRHRNGTETIKTRMKLGMMGVKLEYFVHHTYAPKPGVLTWTLDYGRLSDLIDSVGYWSVSAIEGRPGAASRVFYSVDAALPSWVPSFVVTAVTKKALTDATSWVKVESEKAQAARGDADVAAAGSGGGDGSGGDSGKCKLRWSWRRLRFVCPKPEAPPPPPPPPRPPQVKFEFKLGTQFGPLAVAVFVLMFTIYLVYLPYR